MDIRTFTEHLIEFPTVDGGEAEAAAWTREQLDALGFETDEWLADADALAGHPSFPDDPALIDTADRPSVAGVLEFGDPDAGPTLVLNGHLDVVPADEDAWSSDPFEPVWGETDDGAETLTARGAVDMKAPVAACVFAALDAAERAEAADLNGRLVVEAVAGEEEGGIGAAAAALSNPYPFERDAAIVAEPTELTPVTAVEGTVMKRLEIQGRAAHAASRWRGEDVLPHFERIRAAFKGLEAERGETVTHPLYEEYPVPWPIVIGIVEAGNWASSVPSSLTAEMRFGVAPGETVDEVEAQYEEALQAVVDGDEWLSEHPPSFERFSIQFEPAETDADEPIVRHLQAAMQETGLPNTDPRGATYGADSRHYVAAGIPTVVFGPGSIEQAHFPDETIRWADVEGARETIAETAVRYLQS
ncbi:MULTISPECIES: M20/M25/M40 family metallo-hydrolase [Halolamina]|uniref:Acetylornithine deacetylase n=1 Tax=Halolamina pelagica TaxID=699431 RepID=A0A1I5UB64_9EURY|nr:MULTISPECIES: M20/M25/M40 family metallo-hydrolase [Halolamina]NHX37209.1 M20/M25/M40 family metallo-hydrolase [Halolamina sp. R1-12]SFP92530.1 acetylornithine deacetylase [Halolamina pelagica]